uniref:Uncharacterized protein n=1 Tax=Ditylenchus dipsaci TaxID=166011 RepID=A0A915D7N7_9BILA
MECVKATQRTWKSKEMASRIKLEPIGWASKNGSSATATKLMYTKMDKKQSKVLGSAFLLVSSEHNTTYCQVCGNVLLEEPINFGDSNLLTNLFHNSKSQQPESSGDAGEQETSGAVAPVLDLGKVVADNKQDSQLSARCGFVAALVLAHSSTQTRWEELSGILAHIPVLSTLMSIVANVEEQKRLAHQSQVFSP